MKKFTLVAALLLISVFAFAQKPVRFGVYLGEATPVGALGQGDAIKKTTEFPLGDISKYALLNEKGDQGYAGIGGNIGFDVTVSLPAGFGVFGGIDIFVNANNSDIRSYFNDWEKQIEKEIGITSAKFNLPNVWNIPILFGVNYLHNFNNIVGIWGEAGIGPNFRLISNFNTEIKYTALQTDPVTGNTYDKETVEMDYDAATTLGFKFGGGVMLWNRMSIGLDYYSLGSAKISGKYELKEGSHVIPTYADDKFKGENDIYSGELVVRVGYHF
ncbi:MAG: hypothetical protein J6T53_02410 [Bacteroidales bacterium]|nr:hypothetical protein [Bacteroidales bacterium]